MEAIMKQNHVIDEMEIVEREIVKSVGKSFNVKDMMEFINSEENTFFYFDRKLNARNEQDSDVYYAWVDTGYCYNNETIFISLVNYDGCFCGHFAGTAKYLVNGLCSRHIASSQEYRKNLKKFQTKYEKRIAKRNVKHIRIEEPEHMSDDAVSKTVLGKMIEECGYEVKGSLKNAQDERNPFIPKELSSITNEIYENLLFPNWCRIEGLDRYIKIMGTRTKQLVDEGKTEYFVKNSITSVVINSGLPDLYGNFYQICYRYHVTYGTYTPYKIMRGKQDYLEEGYTKDDASRWLKPITFFDKGTEIFEPTMADFDINQKDLIHIIEERRNRFPESIQNESSEKLFSCLKKALERGIQMQMGDHSYAKASYSGKDGKITWLFPFHVEATITEEPELVMVIRKSGEFYEVKTVLSYNEETKDKITALSLYRKLW